ncbi:MAG TPA: glycoside hydrolase family 27 protein [Chthoniobacterales bacterium]|jgi:alpha-galactosidase|nr:glycoside hydrolase family 27 protein [Chthoniobacterales bacterium]
MQTNKLRCFLAGFLALIGITVSCSRIEAAELTGTWIINIQDPNIPHAEKVILTFSNENGVIKGVMNDATPLEDIKLAGDQVSFFVTIGPPGSPKVPFAGAIAGDELHLKAPLTPDGKLTDIIARRATADEIAALEGAKITKLPLPPLRELPSNGLAQTPPMGWGSYNRFGLTIDDKLIRAIADALVDSGMRDAGYEYLEIDDGWQGDRDASGVLQPSAKFPDMKSLSDYIHSKGLRFCIYTSPGPKTCGGFTGSYGHEEQDAKTFAEWGADYLKYDWCTALSIYTTADEMRADYQKMGQALISTGRPIVYSLCQYGLFSIWEWGAKAGGNLWRTSFDIKDNWKSISDIGFSQNGLEGYAGPGHWNDPDMLEVGNGGMSTEEYRTHMTLWVMLAAPLMAGNDPREMSDETKEILLNREVILVDQDPLGKQGKRILQHGDIEAWTKELDDGSVAVALFNRGQHPEQVSVKWSELNLNKPKAVRDLWKKTDLEDVAEAYATELPPHGSVLLKLTE